MADRDVRWLIRKDLRRVLEIDGASFDQPWLESDFLGALRQRNAICLVIYEGGEVVGFLVYRLRKGEIELVRLAVDIVHRRQGIGSQLVGLLVSKLTHQRRNVLRVVVPESWYEAQVFFRACGLSAVQVLRGEFGDEDGYRFEFRRPGAAEFDAEDCGDGEGLALA